MLLDKDLNRVQTVKIDYTFFIQKLSAYMYSHYNVHDHFLWALSSTEINMIYFDKINHAQMHVSTIT